MKYFPPKLSKTDIFDSLVVPIRVNLNRDATIYAIDYKLLNKLHTELRAELYQQLAIQLMVPITSNIA